MLFNNGAIGELLGHTGIALDAAAHDLVRLELEEADSAEHHRQGDAQEDQHPPAKLLRAACVQRTLLLSQIRPDAGRDATSLE